MVLERRFIHRRWPSVFLQRNADLDLLPISTIKIATTPDLFELCARCNQPFIFGGNALRQSVFGKERLEGRPFRQERQSMLRVKGRRLKRVGGENALEG